MPNTAQHRARTRTTLHRAASRLWLPLLMLTIAGPAIAEPAETHPDSPAPREAHKASKAATAPVRGDEQSANRRKAAQAPTAPSGVVNLNTADEAALQQLPGIGPAKAKAIVELRTRIKKFRRIEQLMRVRGIGRKTFVRLRPMLTVDGETTLTPKPTRR